MNGPLKIPLTSALTYRAPDHGICRRFFRWRRTERLLTHEDVDRARDRWEVAQARRKAASNRSAACVCCGFWSARVCWSSSVRMMHPACCPIRQTAARYGVGFFIPFVVLTFVMGFIVQEMTVRLGAVTHRGHAELIFDRFGKFWGFFAMSDLILGNFLTLVTEFIGVRAGLGFFGIRPAVAVGGALVVVAGAITTGRYWTWERITLSLAIFNGLFIPAAILARPDWHAVGRAMVTWMPLPTGSRYDILVLILATIGATVTPWMLFFQQSAVVDKGMQPRDINAGRFDTFLGVLYSLRSSRLLRFSPPCRCFITVSTPPIFKPRNSPKR